MFSSRIVILMLISFFVGYSSCSLLSSWFVTTSINPIGSEKSSYLGERYSSLLFNHSKRQSDDRDLGKIQPLNYFRYGLNFKSKFDQTLYEYKKFHGNMISKGNENLKEKKFITALVCDDDHCPGFAVSNKFSQVFRNNTRFNKTLKHRTK
jgi:hypothetical protein